jgi:prepilin-type N-terminal cleavage/methylation domain-containing protein
MTRAGRRAGGFTLIELLIGMLLLLVLMLLGAPAFMRMLERQKAYSATTELAALMRQARLEAVKRGVMSGVTLDYQTRTATAFVDLDASRQLSAGDETIGQVVLPTNIEPWGPGDAGPGGAAASVGFPEGSGADDANEGIALFDSTGAARIPGGAAPPWGAFRLKARDENFFEVRVSPPITGRVSVLKWVGGDADDEDSWWENGKLGKAWRWYDTDETPAPPEI